MFPGLASDPNKSGDEESAFERLTNNRVRPSSPTIGFDSVTWNPAAIFSVVMSASPFAKKPG